MQLPVIYLLSEHVGPFAIRLAFLCLPTATHESSGHSCSRWGKWVPDGKVFCVYMYVCITCHMRECFYCTSGLSHIPRVMWGRLAGWWRTCGCSLLYLKVRWLSTKQLVCTLHVYVHACTGTRVLIIARMHCKKKKNWTLQSTILPAPLCMCAASCKVKKTWKVSLVT